MTEFNPIEEQVRLVDELLQTQNKIKELISNKKYILWLDEFTKTYPKFCDDNWLYKPGELSTQDTQMVSYLGYFFGCIKQYAEKNYLPAYSDNSPFYNSFYLIKFNNILYRIGIVSGQGTYFYCQRFDKTDLYKCIDFEDIVTNKQQETVNKIEMLSNIVQFLCSCDVHPDIIRDTVDKTIYETTKLKAKMLKQKRN